VSYHLLPESLADVADGLAEQLGFAGEVVLQGTGSHTGTLGDSAGRGTRIALLDEARDRRIKQLRAGRRTALCLGTTRARGRGERGTHRAMTHIKHMSCFGHSDCCQARSSPAALTARALCLAPTRRWPVLAGSPESRSEHCVGSIPTVSIVSHVIQWAHGRCHHPRSAQPRRRRR